MMKTAVLILLFLVAGCATFVTEESRKIKVIHDGSLEPYSDCKQLAVVHGEAGSFLSGGDYGLFYATNDARNKAARIPDADTLVITDSQGKVFGGEVTGIAYDCDASHSHAIKKATREFAPVDTAAEKALKCRAKGGVWNNNQCVIPIE